MEMVLYALIGVAAGVSSGFFGIGGGIIIVPALIYLGHMGQAKAQGTSLATLLLPIGALGVWEYFKQGKVDVQAGLLVALGFVFGVLGGSRLALGMDETLLRRLFAGFLIVIALQLAFRK